MSRRTGRPRVGEERLTRERIVREALRVVDAEGLAALSMRRLAAALGVDPMAIYHHLPGKEALLAALVAHVYGDLRVPLGDGTWQERVRAFARAYRDVVRAHPHFFRHLVANAAAAATATLEASEALYAALEAAGLPPRLVVRAADVVVDYVHGFALAEATAPLGQPEDGGELLAQLASRPPDQLPVTRRVLGALTDYELAADFDFGLGIVLAGIQAIARDAGGGTNGCTT